MIPLFIELFVVNGEEAEPRLFQINEIQTLHACYFEPGKTELVFRNGATARVVGDYDTVKRAIQKETADVIRYVAVTMGNYL